MSIRTFYETNMKLILGLLLVLGTLGLGLILGYGIKSFLNDNLFFNSAKLPRWVRKFLDEEQQCNLIDYQIIWYAQKTSNTYTNLRVLLKSYHFIFIEVLLKQRIDKLTQFFRSEIPRW